MECINAYTIENQVDTKAVDCACKIIREGKSIIVPTDTVYGLAVDAFSEIAVEKLYTMKGRVASKPLVLQISNPEMAKRYLLRWTSKWELLTETFWPGALTILDRKSALVPEWITAGGDVVGLRCPNERFLLALIEMCGKALAITSANVSGQSSLKEITQKLPGFFSPPDLIVDGGTTSIGIESTVLNLTQDKPYIVRQGAVSQKNIEKVLGIQLQV